MSSIPNSAMPHAYVHDEESEAGSERGSDAQPLPPAALLIGGAALGYLLYRIIR